jgi:hypothetical protein
VLKIYWGALWRHLSFGLCRHRDLRRVKEGGVWYFVCQCGYRVPMLERSAAAREA